MFVVWSEAPLCALQQSARPTEVSTATISRGVVTCGSEFSKK